MPSGHFGFFVLSANAGAALIMRAVKITTTVLNMSESSLRWTSSRGRREVQNATGRYTDHCCSQFHENVGTAPAARSLHEARLLDSCRDEGPEQRVGFKRPRFEFGMELDADEPGVVGILHRLR
jgi:hypothetical protein